jgi:hypothetical protein
MVLPSSNSLPVAAANRKLPGESMDRLKSPNSSVPIEILVAVTESAASSGVY